MISWYNWSIDHWRRVGVIVKNYDCKLLVDEVKKRINDQEYSDDVIISFLNSAQLEILGEEAYPFLEKIHSYDSIGEGEMALPLDYQSTFQVLLDGRPLEYMPYKSYVNQSVAGCYTIYGNRLFFRSFSETPAELRLFYLAKPYIMGRDDEPLIPYEFMEILILGALWRVEENRDNFDFATVYRQHQDELVLSMKKRYLMRHQGVKNRARIHFGNMGRIY